MQGKVDAHWMAMQMRSERQGICAVKGKADAQNKAG
jgi:hypothetical protein